MSRDPLDYETPGRKPPVLATAVCPSCGARELIEGRLTSDTPIRFVPKRVKSFWKFNGGVKTLTYACLSCGAITTAIDPDDLRRLVDEPAADDSPS
jgi:DNA-directed RNA polymerase subunit RPC12/RpoP